MWLPMRKIHFFQRTVFLCRFLHQGGSEEGADDDKVELEKLKQYNLSNEQFLMEKYLRKSRSPPKKNVPVESCINKNNSINFKLENHYHPTPNEASLKWKYLWPKEAKQITITPENIISTFHEQFGENNNNNNKGSHLQNIFLVKQPNSFTNQFHSQNFDRYFFEPDTDAEHFLRQQDHRHKTTQFRFLNYSDVYELFKKESGGSFQHVGRYVTIPGLPQYPSNYYYYYHERKEEGRFVVKENTIEHQLEKADGAPLPIPCTVISLEEYLSFICPSYGKETHHRRKNSTILENKESSPSPHNNNKNALFTFAPPSSFAEDNTSRGPNTRRFQPPPEDTHYPPHHTNSFEPIGRPKNYKLLPMETFFKLTDNSAEETEKEATQNSKKTETLRKHIRENSAQDAAEHFCFTNEPLLVPHPQTMVAVEKPTAHKVKKRAQQMIHVTNTVLLYREEYFRGSGAEPLQSDDNNNKDEETTPIEESEIQRRITHKSSNPNFFKEKENFQQQYLRNCELLLTSELVSSKAMDDKKKKSTQIRKNEASFKKVKQFYKKNNIVTISKFAPKKYLLKKYNWTSRPVQLAEEMRYGLIVFFSK